MYNYDEYDEEDEGFNTRPQKINRTTKAPKQKNYKKQRKKDYRKEIKFKESMENENE